MSNKLIELKNLTKNFDDQQVLRGINLDIHENEFLTLLGPSGCGKTTTLRIIAGFPSFLHIKGRSIRYSRNMRCFHILMLWTISVSA